MYQVSPFDKDSILVLGRHSIIDDFGQLYPADSMYARFFEIKIRKDDGKKGELSDSPSEFNYTY